MFGLQPTHLLIILIVALLIFVPSRLPELVRALRQTIVELRTSFRETAQDATADPHHQSGSEK